MHEAGVDKGVCCVCVREREIGGNVNDQGCTRDLFLSKQVKSEKKQARAGIGFSSVCIITGLWRPVL